jgi:hypothetical protein
MKRLSVKIMILFWMPLGLLGQQSAESLMGYWVEQGRESEITLSTLLVFEKSNAGDISGKLYFLDSEDENQAFKLQNIKVTDQSFSFFVEHTSISFYGRFNPQASTLSGAYYLNDDLVIESVHEKLDPEKAQRIERQQKFVPKKHIDHTSGLIIG